MVSTVLHSSWFALNSIFSLSKWDKNTFLRHWSLLYTFKALLFYPFCAHMLTLLSAFVSFFFFLFYVHLTEIHSTQWHMLEFSNTSLSRWIVFCFFFYPNQDAQSNMFISCDGCGKMWGEKQQRVTSPFVENKWANSINYRWKDDIKDKERDSWSFADLVRAENSSPQV